MTANRSALNEGRSRRIARRASAIDAITAAMKEKWPSSTPMLNNSSASGMCPCGSPASLSPPAKPRPCRRPNVNATSQGWPEPADRPARKRYRRDHRGDERKMAQLDADAEQQQRERDVSLRQPRFAQSACKTQTVQEAERERAEPGLALGQTRAPSRRRTTATQDFGRHKNNAQSDDRLYGRLGDVNEFQRGQGERDAVRHRKRGHGF